MTESFGLFFFDQSTLLLRNRFPFLRDKLRILAPLHQGTQYVLIADEIYKFTVDGKFSVLYKNKCLDKFFTKMDEIYKTLSQKKY